MTKIIYHTLETLHALCTEVGDCWEWNRSKNSQNMPQCRHGGKVHSARKLAYTLAGNKVKDGYVVVPTCRNHKCINPECSKQMTIAKFAAMRAGSMAKNLSTRKKLSTAARKNAKLTPELVQEIRNSDKPGRQWVAETGISLKTIWNAKNGHTWKEYASPWSGLGAR